MKSNRLLNYFTPLLMLIAAWSGIVLLRAFFLLEHTPVSSGAQLYLALFWMAFIWGIFASTLLYSGMRSRAVEQFSERSVSRKANQLIVLSLVSIAILVVNFVSQMSGEFSLTGITEQRFAKARDESHEMGGTVLGALGLLLSGFTIFQFIFKEYFGAYLSLRKKKIMNAVFVCGILVSLLAGGRWAASVALLVVGLMWLFRRRGLYSSVESQASSQASVTEGGTSFLTQIRRLLFIVFIIYVFSRMFLDRVDFSDGQLEVLLDILSHNFAGVAVPLGHDQLLRDYPQYIPTYYVISMFEYYATHGIFQFDVLYTADFPTSGPYFGAYQFYLQVLVLNKLWLVFTPISQILSEIPNRGVYFTLAGAYLIDFGYWGGIIASFVTAVIGTFFWARFVAKGGFFDMYVSILFLILILMSPIVAITGTGVFPSMLCLAFVVMMFVPKKQRRS